MTEHDQLEAFLLGTCDEATAAVLEERLFTDDVLLDRLKETEAALMRRHAAGTLPPALRAGLEEQAGRSPRLRAQMDAASLRLANSDAARIAPHRTSLGWWQSHRLAAVGAFALVPLMVGGSIVWYQVYRAPAAVPTSAQAKSAPPARPSEAPLANPGVSVATVFLPRLNLRGSAPVPVVRLARNVGTLEIQAEVSPSPSAATEWTCSLFRRGQLLLQRDHLAERSEGRVTYLSFNVPTDSLPPGTYELRLTQPASEGRPATMATRTFTVAPH